MNGRMKRIGKTACALLAVAAVAVAGGGFMGVNSFMTEERSLTVIDTASPVSSTISTANMPAESDGKDAAGKMKIDAKAAVLIDGSSGRVLFEQNAHKQLPPASVTKVMTLLLIMESCDSGRISLDDKVTISENAADMGGSQMYMEAGEKHTVEELVKGIIMASANDGCVAMAEHLHGSVGSFVDAMNEKASELGLKDSHFVNTNGLPVANHYSSAYDIGIISKELMKHERAHKWFTSWQENIEVGLPGKEKKFTLTNTNRLIKSYSGAIGVKTGYTDDAGYCLSGAAERDSTRMIAVVLGCKTSDIRFAEMSRLLDYGFAGFETVQIAGKGDKLDEIEIAKADCTKVAAVTEEAVGITVAKGDKKGIKKEVVIDEKLTLPLKKGSRIGTLNVYDGKEKAASYDLVSDRDVEPAGFITTYIRMMKNLV